MSRNRDQPPVCLFDACRMAKLLFHGQRRHGHLQLTFVFLYDLLLWLAPSQKLKHIAAWDGDWNVGWYSVSKVHHLVYNKYLPITDLTGVNSVLAMKIETFELKKKCIYIYNIRIQYTYIYIYTYYYYYCYYCYYCYCYCCYYYYYTAFRFSSVEALK